MRLANIGTALGNMSGPPAQSLDSQLGLAPDPLSEGVDLSPPGAEPPPPMAGPQVQAAAPPLPPPSPAPETAAPGQGLPPPDPAMGQQVAPTAPKPSIMDHFNKFNIRL